MSRILARWRFSTGDQQAFAVLSGDWNAIHLDARSARRELFGRRILHGLHGALRASEALLDALQRPVRMTRLRARFLAPVFLGEEVTLELNELADTEASLVIRNPEQVLYELMFQWQEGAPPSVAPARSPRQWTRSPQDRPFEALGTLRGSLDTTLDLAAASRQFPRVVAATPGTGFGALLAVTRLVGMESPGRQSLLSAFDLTLMDGSDEEMRYNVTTTDARFSIVRMVVAGGGLEGKVEAFYRPRPVDQGSFADLAGLVTPGARSGATALIIGGSRGLGEVAAKLLAAAGARVIVTSRRLGERAEAVAAEIRAGGGDCGAIAWNALDPADGARALAALDASPSDLLYFATPKVPGRKPARFSKRALRNYVRYYVEGLEGTVRAVRQRTRGPLTVFYPSTALLDEPTRSSGEYAIAKAAGEQACRQLALTDRDLRLMMPRLPRMATDQSQGLSPTPVADATTVMLDALTLRRKGEP